MNGARPGRPPYALLFAMLLTGCAAPAEGGLDAPMPASGGLVPSGWRPAEGIGWGNLTGTIEAGRCSGIEGRVVPPVLGSWWLRASPNITLLVANWTPRGPGGSLCAEEEGEPGVRILRDVERMNATEELGDGREGYDFALRCEAEVDCHVQWWTQSIRQITRANGTWGWAGEPGPAPAEYGA